MSFLFIFPHGRHYISSELGAQGVLISAFQACVRRVKILLPGRSSLSLNSTCSMCSCTWYMTDVVPWSGGIASRNRDEVLVQVESLMCSLPFLLSFLFFLPLSSSVLFLQPPFLCCSLSSMSSHVIEICIRREHAEGSKVFGYLWNQWRTKKQAQRIGLIVSLNMSASPPFWKNVGTLVGVSINVSMSILGNIIYAIESFTRNES